MLVPAPAQLPERGGAEHPLGSQVAGGASVPQFLCRKEPCKLQGVIFLKSNEEELEIIISNASK